MSHVRHELLTDVADQISVILKEYNVDPVKAEQAGAAVSNHLAEHWGGQLITFPKDHLYKITQRDLQIFQEVDAHNIHEVARKYNLTTNAIYRVIKRIRRLAVAERQPDLF